ncbi:g4316 [Coccomyxa elongata]
MDAANLSWASAPLTRIQAAQGRKGIEETTHLQVPVVDLAEPDEVAAQKMRSACEDYGFLYVANHGVSQQLVDEQFSASKRFFAQPLKSKLALKADRGNRGYFPFGTGSAKNPFSQEDRKEAFNAYGFETEDLDQPFHGRNKWPAEEHVPGFRSTMERYYGAMHSVAQRVLRLLALALDLPADFFNERFSRPVANIRAVHYIAGQPSNADQGIFGVGPHTDWGALTILATDNERGLQICVGSTWIDVDPRPGMFVVNLGDMVDRWTNGRFRSTLHRVVNTSERFSTPFFLAANWDAELAVLPNCQVAGELAEVAPATTTCGAWLTMRRTAEYDKKRRIVEEESEAAPQLPVLGAPQIRAQ